MKIHPYTVVMNGEIGCRDQNDVFVPGCKLVYICCKVSHFNIELYGNWLTCGASLKWPFEELQFFGTFGAGCSCWLPTFYSNVIFWSDFTHVFSCFGVFGSKGFFWGFSTLARMKNLADYRYLPLMYFTTVSRVALTGATLLDLNSFGVRRWVPLQMVCTCTRRTRFHISLFHIWCNFSPDFENGLRLKFAAGGEPFESKAKVVISVWGIIMENPQEPSFSEAKLNLPPLSVFLSVSYASLFILHFSVPHLPPLVLL